MSPPRPWSAPTTLLLVGGVVVAVATGMAHGLWWSNLHNGLLALSFAGVGAYVLHERPGHPEGRLLLGTGVVEAVMFLARQLAHADPAAASPWVAWLGVWPVPLALGLTTAAVLAFPDGRLPAPRWRPVAVAVAGVTVVSCVLSAGWRVGYASAGVTTAHPLGDAVPGFASALWSAVSVPSFVALQLLWVVALVARWRRAVARPELVWLLAACALSAAALATGLLVEGSPRAGLLAACLVPVAAGVAIVHGRHVATRAALTWLSRSGADPARLPGGLAAAAARALSAPAATVWMGPETSMRAIGVWPDRQEPMAVRTLADLAGSPGSTVRPVMRGDELVGALEVLHPGPLSRSQERLVSELAGQAAFVLEHVSLAAVIDRQQRRGALDGLTPREHQVLELIARGLSNSAICDELHLSIKTVEPLVGTVFAKLGLHADSASNRRVLAALQYQRATTSR